MTSTWRSRFNDEREKRLEERITHVRELSEAHRMHEHLAVETALQASKELADKHNDLIRAGEKKDETYATKTDLNRLEATVSKLNGVTALVGVAVVANIVEAFF